MWARPWARGESGASCPSPAPPPSAGLGQAGAEVKSLPGHAWVGRVLFLQRGAQPGFLPLPYPGLPIPAPPSPTASAWPKRLPLSPRLPQETLAFREELDVLKFLCKDLWVAVFQKQMDSLRTNHQVCRVCPGPSFPTPGGD